MAPPSSSDDRVLLYGLVFGCPFETESSDCPLAPVRRRPPLERVAWVRSLDEATVVRIMAAHRACRDRRESA